MITDIHTHIFDEPTYRTYMKRAEKRIGKVISIHYFLRLHEVRPSIQSLDDLLAFAARKKNVFVAAAIDMNRDVSSQLEKIESLFKEKKIVGVKLYPGYQRFYVSDKSALAFAALCEKYKKPLIIHAGDVFDRFGTAELKYSRPIHVDSLAIRYPKCKIVIAHFGFPYFLETANVVSKNKNVFTDISGTIDSSLSTREGRKLTNQYIHDLDRAFAYYPGIREKVMFGTDYGGETTPLNQVEPYIQVVKRLFRTKERRLVFSGLAETLFFS